MHADKCTHAGTNVTLVKWNHQDAIFSFLPAYSLLYVFLYTRTVVFLRGNSCTQVQNFHGIANVFTRMKRDCWISSSCLLHTQPMFSSPVAQCPNVLTFSKGANERQNCSHKIQGGRTIPILSVVFAQAHCSASHCRTGSLLPAPLHHFWHFPLSEVQGTCWTRSNQSLLQRQQYFPLC